MHSNSDEGDFVANLRQSSGAGFSHDWAFGVDSKLGLQLDAKFSPTLSGVLQVVSQQRPEGNYEPEVEWANLRYQPQPDLSLRVGRILLPAYMVAESRMVGFANTWVRPPIDPYNLAQVTKSDGIDVSYRLHNGSTINTVQVFFGRQNQDFVFSVGPQTGIVSARLRQIAGIANTVERGPWTVRAAFITANVGVNDVKGRARFYTAGLMYDSENWFIQSEWSGLDSKLLVQGREPPHRNGFYATLGYRWGNFTPYLTLSHTGASGDPPRSPASPPEQRTTSAGVRWDVARNAALKAQFDRISLGGADTGHFVNTQPGFPAGGTIKVFSIALDFVF